jgi:peptide/nickel transport system ATP-binding protein
VPQISVGFGGCAFRSRCSFADDGCAGSIPSQTVTSGHTYLCRLTPKPYKELARA